VVSLATAAGGAKGPTKYNLTELIVTGTTATMASVSGELRKLAEQAQELAGA